MIHSDVSAEASVAKPISRRGFLRGAAAGAIGAGGLILVGCGADDAEPSASPTTAPRAPATNIPPTSAPTPSAPPIWRQISFDAGPGARRDPSLTAIDTTTLYTFGGRLRGQPNAELWQFDVGRSAWSPIDAVGPEARFAHNAFYDASRKRFVIALGQGGAGFFNDVWSFDSQAGTWSQLDAASTERPSVRYGSGGAYDSAGDRILISHGFTETGRFDDTWQFDFKTSQWSRVETTGPVPIKRCLVRTLWIPQRSEMLLFGGQTDDNPFLGDFWSLDPDRGLWTEHASPTRPGPRNLYGADAISGRWYAVGGNTAAGPTGETWVYDVADDAWATLATGGSWPGRYSLDAAIAGTTLYAFGGSDGSSDLGDLWALDLGV